MSLTISQHEYLAPETLANPPNRECEIVNEYVQYETINAQVQSEPINDQVQNEPINRQVQTNEVMSEPIYEQVVSEHINEQVQSKSMNKQEQTERVNELQQPNLTLLSHPQKGPVTETTEKEGKLQLPNKNPIKGIKRSIAAEVLDMLEVKKKKTVTVCKVCGQKWICCDQCDKWSHKSCEKVDNKTFRQIEAGEDILWKCSTCR